MNARFVSAALLVSAFSSFPLAAQGQGGGAPTLTGYLQPRFESIGESAVFYLRRARFGMQGNPTRWATFRVQVDARVGAEGRVALGREDVGLRRRVQR